MWIHYLKFHLSWLWKYLLKKKREWTKEEEKKWKSRLEGVNFKKCELLWVETTICMNYYVYLRPRSDLKVPPYFGREPIRSMISGMQLANTAYHWSGEDTWRARRRSDDDVVHTCRHREERTEGKEKKLSGFSDFWPSNINTIHKTTCQQHHYRRIPTSSHILWNSDCS